MFDSFADLNMDRFGFIEPRSDRNFDIPISRGSQSESFRYFYLIDVRPIEQSNSLEQAVERTVIRCLHEM